MYGIDRWPSILYRGIVPRIFVLPILRVSAPRHFHAKFAFGPSERRQGSTCYAYLPLTSSILHLWLDHVRAPWSALYQERTRCCLQAGIARALSSAPRGACSQDGVPKSCSNCEWGVQIRWASARDRRQECSTALLYSSLWSSNCSTKWRIWRYVCLAPRSDEAFLVVLSCDPRLESLSTLSVPW